MASGGVRQASFDKTISKLRSFLRASGHTLFEYPLGMPLEAKLLKEGTVACSELVRI